MFFDFLFISGFFIIVVYVNIDIIFSFLLKIAKEQGQSRFLPKDGNLKFF